MEVSDSRRKRGHSDWFVRLSHLLFHSAKPPAHCGHRARLGHVRGWGPPTPVTAEGKWGPRAGGLGPPATTVISCSWFCSPVTIVFMCLTSRTFKVSRLKTWILLTPQITLAGRSLWSEILSSFNHSTSECYTFYTNTCNEWIKQKHNTPARLRGSGAFIIKLWCYPFGWHALV